MKAVSAHLIGRVVRFMSAALVRLWFRRAQVSRRSNPCKPVRRSSVWVSPQFSPPARNLFCLLFCCAVSLHASSARAEWDLRTFLSSLFQRKEAAQSRYPITDSRTVAHTLGVGAPQFYWINNDELLFVPKQITPDASAPNKERVTFSLARWHTRTGVIRTLKEFGNATPRLCFFEGYVLIEVEGIDNSRLVYHGALGAERADNPKRYYDRNLCRPVDALPALPSWTEGRHIRWLEHPSAGFIDFGELNQAMNYAPLRLYKHGARQEEGIELPLYRRRVIPRFPYFAFKDAFFVESDWDLHPRPKDAPYPVYWLYRDGRIEKIVDIPWGNWRSRASSSVVPTSLGLLIVSSNTRGELDLDHAGIYLHRGNTVEKIVTAWVEGHSVMISPNGCRAAFTVAKTVTRKRNVLQVAELCDGGKR